MLHIDTKYLLLSSSRLRNFKQKSEHLYNCSCPVCGDSKTKATRARLYIFKGQNQLVVKCHNCQYAAGFSRFLQWLDPTTHKDYTYEKFLSLQPYQEVTDEPQPDVHPPKLLGTLRTAQDLTIKSIASLPEGHPARAYIASRKVPDRYWSKLYYTSNFRAFLDMDFPEHTKKEAPSDDRIVIPFFNADNYISYVTGRALTFAQIRYMTVKILDEKKMYGLDTLTHDSNAYVVEGPFDSMFLPNCVASADANVLGAAEHLRYLGYNRMTLVFDNEPRNEQIVAQMEKAIDRGFKIAMLPHKHEAKDLNDLIKGGLTEAGLHEYVDRHTYHGPLAKLELSRWRRV